MNRKTQFVALLVGTALTSALLLVRVLTHHANSAEASGGSITVSGPAGSREWEIFDGGCAYTYSQAAKALPARYELPSVEDLLAFAKDANVRTRFPVLFERDSRVWTNQFRTIVGRPVVVRLTDGKTESQVDDLPACVVVRKAD